MSGVALYRKYRAITDVVKQFETSDASLVFRSSRKSFFPVFGLTACEYALGYICPESSVQPPQPAREKRQREEGAPARRPRAKKPLAEPAAPSRHSAEEDFAGDSTFLQTVVPTNRPRRRSARIAKGASAKA